MKTNQNHKFNHTHAGFNSRERARADSGQLRLVNPTAPTGGLSRAQLRAIVAEQLG